MVVTGLAINIQCDHNQLETNEQCLWFIIRLMSAVICSLFLGHIYIYIYTHTHIYIYIYIYIYILYIYIVYIF